MMYGKRWLPVGGLNFGAGGRHARVTFVTCIAGIADGTSVWMGADSMASDSWNKYTSAEGKLWKTGSLLFGGCGNIRPLQVIKHHLTVPQQADDQNVEEYLVANLTDSIAHTLDEHGMLTKKWRIHGGGSLMLGYQGALYHIACDLSILAYADGYGADGSGGDHALGSLFSTKTLSNPKKRLTTALEAASHHGLYVAPPFVIMSVGS